MNYEEMHKIDVRITFNEVTRNAWETAKEEINSILKNAKGHDLINLFENEKPTNAQILSLFFARESQFSKVLMSHLQIDYITLLRWLNDVCIQAVYQLSPEDLYNDELFQSVLLLSYTENNMIWKKFSVANQSSNSVLDNGRAGDFVYEELQTEYNRISRNLTIRNRSGNIDIVVDDDKVFGEIDSSKNSYGLKYVKHVKDNRQGYNCHCAATTCTLFPIAIKWEKQGESSNICIKKMLEGLFRNTAGGYPDFRHVTLFCDRGYWTPSLVYFLLSCGAFVVGTLMRNLCWPLTFSQERKENDKRTFLDPKGPPTLFLKRLQNNKTRNQRLTIGAFCSGTENISLAMSSKYHENQWDCILIDPSDYDLYLTGELKMKSFVRLDIEKHDEATEQHIEQMIAYLQAQKVKAITITQGTVDWKYGRRFSFTSASSYDIIKFCTSQLWHLYESKPHWQALKAYLDGSFTIDHDEDQQVVSMQQHQDLEDEFDSDYIPQSTVQQVSFDIYCLNADQLTANELPTSPFYSNKEYLEEFLNHVTRKSDANSRKKKKTTTLGALRISMYKLEE
jgi:hypothetical protein